MARFKSKAVEIDAVRWTGGNMDEVLPFIQDGREDLSHLPKAPDDPHVNPGIGYTPADGKLYIPTPEGTMAASPGDWIIKGTEGEFYPCKPSVFERKYEPA